MTSTIDSGQMEAQELQAVEQLKEARATIRKELSKVIAVEEIREFWGWLSGRRRPVNPNRVYTLGLHRRTHFYPNCKTLKSARGTVHEQEICLICLERKQREIEEALEANMAGN